MIRVLFICLGNICRSPMGEFILKKMVEEQGLKSKFEIGSAATSTEEIGNPVYPAARRKLAEHGIGCDGKRARQVTKGEYQQYDYFLCMDRRNVENTRRIFGGDPQGKIHMLMEFSGRDGTAEVSDPWYTDDFDTAYNDIYSGCKGFLERVVELL